MSLAPPKFSPMTPGHRLDRYELLCPIAEGGMATVWMGRLLGKHGFEKLVAIKSILPKYASDRSFQQMFLDEARVVARIRHLNVAQIHDLGEESGNLYFIMEWIDGDALLTLHRTVTQKGSNIPLGILLRILADTCAGLHAAHELRDENDVPLEVVHRDVSPQNILLSQDGIAKLIDFGIAKARDRLAADTKIGVVKGKIMYMSPEQARGGTVDRRADVWSVGAVMYRLLAGRAPFEAPSPVAALGLLCSGKPPPPLPGSVPPGVRALIENTLCGSPDARFDSAYALKEAIEAAMSEADVATTTADVQSFIAHHLAHRADARKEAVDVALRTSSHRTRAAKPVLDVGAEVKSEEAPTAGGTSRVAAHEDMTRNERTAIDAAIPEPGTPVSSVLLARKRPHSRWRKSAAVAAGVILAAVAIKSMSGAGRAEATTIPSPGRREGSAAVRTAATWSFAASIPSVPSAASAPSELPATASPPPTQLPTRIDLNTASTRRPPSPSATTGKTHTTGRREDNEDGF